MGSKERESSSDSGKDPSDGVPKKKRGHSTKADPCERKKKGRKKQSRSEDHKDDGYVQVTHSDESDERESEINKESDSEAVEDQLKVQMNTVKNALRGMHTRVVYWMMADGISSENEAA